MRGMTGVVSAALLGLVLFVSSGEVIAQGNPGPVERGRELFTQHGCHGCHTVGVYPDRDRRVGILIGRGT